MADTSIEALEKLKAELDTYSCGCWLYGEDRERVINARYASAILSELIAAKREREEIREALEPLRKTLTESKSMGPGYAACFRGGVKWGDLRSLAALAAKLKEGK